jgi:N-acetylglucosaminyl-diphospho-decaprenol L-rhamnosyltransferase
LTAQALQEILLSIVIINFRTPALVIDCLRTLLPELSGLAAKVVLVDNHSGDDSPRIIRDWVAMHDNKNKILFVQSGTNSGFAGGNNTGIKALEGKYYLLLNSDALVRPGSILKLLETATRCPRAGLVSPRLEWPDGSGQESCFRFHTPYSEFIDAAQTGFIEKFLGSFVVAMPVQDRIARPNWTSFACVLIRREVFAEIGLLDDGYFMYFEDVEFCYRAHRAGWDVVHNPEARIVHLRGGTSPVKEKSRQKKRLPKYYYESRTRYFYQQYGWFGLTAANLMWWLGRLVSKARQAIGRSDKAAIEMQWLDIWTNWFQPLRPYAPPKS